MATLHPNMKLRDAKALVIALGGEVEVKNGSGDIRITHPAIDYAYTAKNNNNADIGKPLYSFIKSIPVPELAALEDSQISDEDIPKVTERITPAMRGAYKAETVAKLLLVLNQQGSAGAEKQPLATLLRVNQSTVANICTPMIGLGLIERIDKTYRMTKVGEDFVICAVMGIVPTEEPPPTPQKELTNIAERLLDLADSIGNSEIVQLELVELRKSHAAEIAKLREEMDEAAALLPTLHANLAEAQQTIEIKEKAIKMRDEEIANLNRKLAAIRDTLGG